MSDERQEIIEEIHQAIEQKMEELDRKYSLRRRGNSFELAVRIDPPLDYVTIKIVNPED